MKIRDDYRHVHFPQKIQIIGAISYANCLDRLLSLSPVQLDQHPRCPTLVVVPGEVKVPSPSTQLETSCLHFATEPVQITWEVSTWKGRSNSLSRARLACSSESPVSLQTCSGVILSKL